MSEKLDKFRSLVDGLREARRVSIRKGQHFYDTVLLNDINVLVDEMDDDEQEIANNEGWRGWPDLYDAHMSQMMIEDVDPDDPSKAGNPPRRFPTFDDVIK